MTEIIPILGSELKVILKRRKITQAELSEEFGVHRTTINRYFSDDIKMPYDFIVRVAAFAGLELKDLVKSGQIVRRDVIIKLDSSPALSDDSSAVSDYKTEIPDKLNTISEPIGEYAKKRKHRSITLGTGQLEDYIHELEDRIEALEKIIQT